MKKMHGTKEQGYLTLVLLMILLITSLASMVVVHTYSSNAMANMADMWNKQSFAIAEGGMQRTIYNIGYASAPVSCLAAATTSQALGNGQYDVTTVQYDGQINPPGSPPVAQPPAQLTANISAIATDIPVSIHPFAALAPSGRVTIDSEIIEYTNLTGSALRNAVRGVGGSVAAVHSAGARITQNQCDITVTAGIPTTNATTALGRSQIRMALQLASRSAWLVGARTGGNAFFATNSSGAWAQLAPSATTNVNMHGISMISATDGWAVGDPSGGEVTYRWDGTNWSRFGPGGIPNDTLHAVYCNSSNDCWAVGDAQRFFLFFNYKYVAHYDGVNWSLPSLFWGVAGEDLYGITCTGANHCVAVGAPRSRGAGINDWNGANWAASTVTGGGCNNPNVALYGVACTATNNCWSVGDAINGGSCRGPVFMRWNGSTWVRSFAFVSTGSTQVPRNRLESVSCSNANDCWAVGEKTTVVHWDGVRWSAVNVAGLPGNIDFHGVRCAAADNCVAVGDRSTIISYNGSSWTQDTHALASTEYFAVDNLGSGGGGGGGGSVQAISGWKQNFQ